MNRKAKKFSDPKVVCGVVTEIIGGQDILESQLRLSRRAYNKQISFNRRTRKALGELRLRYCPELRDVSTWYDDGLGYAKDCKETFNRLLKQLRSTESYKQAEKDLYDRINVRLKKAKANLQRRGLFHFSKDASMKDASLRKVDGRPIVPTRFRSRFEHRGGLFIERKRQSKRNIDRPTLEEVFIGGWDLFNMAPASYVRHRNSNNNTRQLFTVKMRVGQKNTDIVTFNCLFWRLPPVTSRIAGIRLIETGKGYALRMTFEASSHKEKWFNKPCYGNGTVASDVGWRKMEDGSVRVAMFIGRDVDELVLPEHYWRQWDMVDNKRGKIDDDFNEVRPYLVDLPKAIFPNVGRWKSKNRFARAFREWREQGGRGAAFSIMRDWYTEYQHDVRHADGRTNNLIAARDHYYKTFAKRLAEKYDTLLFDTIGLQAIARKSKGSKPNKARQRAGLSKLQEALKQCGIKIEEVECKNTSLTCQSCKCMNESTTDQYVACKKCGVIVDRDVRACLNLLGKSEIEGYNWIRHEAEIRAISRRKSNKGKELVANQV